MTKGKAVLFFISLSLIMPASLLAESMTDNWRLTGYTKYRDAVFADAARLSSPAPGITAVWIKIAPSGKSKYRQFVHDYLTVVKKQNPGFKSIEILCEINCTNHLIRYTKFVYLDSDRNIIHEAYDPGATQFLINQGSIWYPVEKEACTAGR
ncbi:MAG: hypothetical protein K4571_17460 [Deltaproteobacteria bacterium]